MKKGDETFTNDVESFQDEHLIIDDGGLVTFDISSSLKPRNWPTSKKLSHTILYGVITFAAQFNSASMTSSVFPQLFDKEFGVGEEVSILCTSLYILGVAIGPMIFAPLSEVYGRKFGVILPFFLSAVITAVTSISYNSAGVFISRFFAGFFAGAPIVSSGGVLADLWDPSFRGIAFGFYSCVVSNGTAFGPIISSLLMISLGTPSAWRLPLWFVVVLDFVVVAISLLVVEESYEPVIISWAAKDLRIKTQQWNIHAKHDNLRLDIHELLYVHCLRPIYMLRTPIVFLIALFASYVYGIFYLSVTTIGEAFKISRGWEGTVSTLPNIALFLGVMIAVFINMAASNRYRRLLVENNGEPIPEERLRVLLYFAWLMPAGNFLFGWTSYNNIHWIVPCIGVVMIGIGFMTIFQNCITYLVDSFPRYAASAVAANTFSRSIFGAVFPLFATQLFRNLGVHWGASLIGFIALAMIPIPFYFLKHGERIRSNSPFSSKIS